MLLHDLGDDGTGCTVWDDWSDSRVIGEIERCRADGGVGGVGEDDAEISVEGTALVGWN